MVHGLPAKRCRCIAKCAIKQVQENESYHSDETAIASLTGCKHTLAKVVGRIQLYELYPHENTVDAVWQAEYESCNSSIGRFLRHQRGTLTCLVLTAVLVACGDEPAPTSLTCHAVTRNGDS